MCRLVTFELPSASAMNFAPSSPILFWSMHRYSSTFILKSTPVQKAPCAVNLFCFIRSLASFTAACSCCFTSMAMFSSSISVSERSRSLMFISKSSTFSGMFAQNRLPSTSSRVMLLCSTHTFARVDTPGALILLWATFRIFRTFRPLSARASSRTPSHVRPVRVRSSSFRYGTFAASPRKCTMFSPVIVIFCREMNWIPSNASFSRSIRKTLPPFLREHPCSMTLFTNDIGDLKALIACVKAFEIMRSGGRSQESFASTRLMINAQKRPSSILVCIQKQHPLYQQLQFITSERLYSLHTSQHPASRSSSSEPELEEPERETGDQTSDSCRDILDLLDAVDRSGLSSAFKSSLRRYQSCVQ